MKRRRLEQYVGGYRKWHDRSDHGSLLEDQAFYFAVMAFPLDRADVMKAAMELLLISRMLKKPFAYDKNGAIL